MVTLLHIFRRSFIYLNMFENQVNIEYAFYQFLIPTTGSDISKAVHELFGQTSYI